MVDLPTPASAIVALGTAVPHTIIRQDAVRDVFARQPGLGRLAQRLIGTAFDASGISTRHTVIAELGESAAGSPGADASEIPGAADASDGAARSTLGDGDPESGPHLFVDNEGRILGPGTALRNAVYAAEAPALYTEAARDALDASGFTAADITHVVTVSCTGFVAPGPDYWLVRELGLADTTQRFHLGFMGCYGAFPALRMADAFCRADPDAVILVVCAELCTLHLRSSEDTDAIVANSVFADGAAAAIVAGVDTARVHAQPGTALLLLDSFASALTPVGEEEMAWTIGDYGFEMVLSSYVPHLVGEYIGGALAPLPTDAATHWAIHPGGHSIVDKVGQAMGLDEATLAPSRAVLNRFGNMSSGTVLFVLKEVLSAGPKTGERVCAVAFGPGLTVESAMLTVARRP